MAFAQGVEVNAAASEQVIESEVSISMNLLRGWGEDPSRVLLYVPRELEAQADEMRGLLYTMMSQTSHLAYTSEEGAEEITRRYGAEGGFADIVERLTDMAGRLQRSFQGGQETNAGPAPMVD